MTKPANKTLSKLKRTRGADHVDQPPAQPVPKAARRRGRPEIELEPEMVRVACVMARYGATDIEIAQELGVSEKTFYAICGRHPSFLQAVRESKEAADDRAEQSMYRLVNGYTYQSEKVFSNGFRAVVHEHVPPNPAMGMNWLANRRGWRKGDNQAQDAIDAVSTLPPGTAPNNQQLALAALALLGAAVHNPSPDVETIDVTPNTVPQQEDEDDGYEPEPDPDFDFDA